MTDLSDAMLLERFRAGEEAALDLLLARYEVPLYQFLLGMLRDHHHAEDALQETFVRALERLDDVDPDHLRGWFFTVAYHQAMLSRRRQKVRRTSPLEVPGDLQGAEPDPLEQVQCEEERQHLRELLEQLPPAQQEVVRQRLWEGKRFREIAAELNCPLNTALARMHEALKRLRLLWEQEHA
jgi:RNA polymerase sigma-70 factor (ECF subfamily)